MAALPRGTTTVDVVVRCSLVARFGLQFISQEWPQVHSGNVWAVRHTFAQIDWDNVAVLAHNMRFDGAILAWHFGITPHPSGVPKDAPCLT